MREHHGVIPPDKQKPPAAPQDVLVIDQAPLLHEAMDACEKARREIEQLKAELHRFETRDVPAYERWYHGTFGKYLTEIREVSSVIRGKEQQLSVVRKKHWDRFFGCSGEDTDETTLGRDSRRSGGFCGAYATWDSHPEDGFAEDYDEDESQSDTEDDESNGEEYRYEEDGSFYDDEQEFHYSEDEEAARGFEDLFVRGTGRRKSAYRARGWDWYEPGKSGSRAGRGPGSDDAREERAGPDADQREARDEAIPPGKDDFRNRIKERYRILVRKLHPDLNPDLSAEAKGLWNQVQAAYRDRNLEQLDLCLVLSDAFAGKISGLTSVHQLRRAAQEIERLTAPLRRKVDATKQNRSWSFTTLQDRAPLHRTLEREFQRDVARLRQKLTELDAQIRRFSRQTTAPRPEAENRL